MHSYIPHLISDIENAHRSELPETVQSQTFEEEMEEIEKWISEGPKHTFGFYCGLSREQFPPPEQLTKKEMKLICKTFLQMMTTWNLDAELPKTLPINRYYQILISTLDKKTSIVNTGFITFDFCTGNAPDCLFKGFCPCLKYWNSK